MESEEEEILVVPVLKADLVVAVNLTESLRVELSEVPIAPVQGRLETVPVGHCVTPVRQFLYDRFEKVAMTRRSDRRQEEDVGSAAPART